MQNRYAILVAGGSGKRMNSDLPKQFLLLDGKPILMHTLERFAQTKSNPQLIVVLHETMLTTWQHLCDTHNFNIPHALVPGGETRFQSVRNGIAHIADKYALELEDILISIHDAARPLIHPNVIDLCFEQTIQHAATALAFPSTNSIRQGNEVQNSAVDREKIWIVQTPQTFRAHILQKAFQQKEHSSFTDDATVVERLGYPIHLIRGSHQNIKVTFPEDIAIAQLYLKSANH